MLLEGAVSGKPTFQSLHKGHHQKPRHPELVSGSIVPHALRHETATRYGRMRTMSSAKPSLRTPSTALCRRKPRWYLAPAATRLECPMDPETSSG